jgi:hypothetical protein
MPDCGECKEQLQAPPMFTLMGRKGFVGQSVAWLHDNDSDK